MGQSTQTDRIRKIPGRFLTSAAVLAPSSTTAAYLQDHTPTSPCRHGGASLKRCSKVSVRFEESRRAARAPASTRVRLFVGQGLFEFTALRYAAQTPRRIPQGYIVRVRMKAPFQIEAREQRQRRRHGSAAYCLSGQAQVTSRQRSHMRRGNRA
jgi:hypothetical protein